MPHRIPLGPYVLDVDAAGGELTGLTRGDSPQALGHGAAIATGGAQLAGRLLDDPPVYHSHRVEGARLDVRASQGPLIYHTRITARGDMLMRQVRIENASQQEVQLTGVRLVLPGVSLGNPAACRFEAPANAVRPRLPLSVAAGQQPDRYTTGFAPGQRYRWGAAISDAPDVGPGLMIVHNPSPGWSLLTWYVSEVEAAHPWVGGDRTHATLGYDVGLAGWLAPGETLGAGTQYVMLQQGAYDEALAAYRATFAQTGVLPPIYGAVDRALDWTGVYEVHPGQHGGFQGLRGAVDRLAGLGFDTLYLLPIHPYRNKRGLPWDEDWEAGGSPYAIHDFESLEPSLGTPGDFQALVDEAHGHNMRVLMDLVLQGSSLEAGAVAEHPGWYARDEAGEMVHSHGWNDTWSFDWANPGYQAFVLRYALNYVERFGVDGFRVDAPHGKEPNWARGLDRHASRTNLGTAGLLAELRRRLAEAQPSAALYCELFGPLWVHSHDISNDYHPYAMLMALAEGDLSVRELGTYLADYWAVMPHGPNGAPTPRICFTETHDTRSGPAYGLRGSRLAQALLGILVMSGFVPMLWSGQERGQEDFVRGLLHARRHSAALRRGALHFNAVTVDDRGHYRRAAGERPAEQVFTVIRQLGDEVLLGLASLLPEQATFAFGLPLADLPIDPAAHYRLRDLISSAVWSQHGQAIWQGAELADLTLTPRMFRPYILRLERVDGA